MSSHACLVSPTSLVSIVIPVFNSAATLERAVRSALCQRVAGLEVLIVDDGSHDRSLAEARSLATLDTRIRVIALPENRGKPHAMNRAIAQARGAWIAVLDADDRYHEDRLAVLIAAAERNGVDLVADNQLFRDAGAGRVVRTAFSERRPDGELTRTDFIAGCNPFAAFNYGMLKPVIRTGFIRHSGLRYRENARLCEDFLYLVEFYAAGGRAFLVAQPLYCWTQAFGSVSRRWTETGAGRWRYDFLAAVTATNEARDGLDARDGDLIALLARRGRALRQLHWLGELSRLRDAGARLPALARAALRHPSILPILAARLLARIRVPGRPAGVDGAAT